MENSSLWQGAILGGILFWLLSSSYLNLTLELRSFLQPFVTHYVQSGTPILLQIQVTKNRAPHNFILLKISSFLCSCCKCWFFLFEFLGYAELQGWISWCSFFWVVLCCFCAILHCFYTYVILGMYNLMILYKILIKKLYIYWNLASV